jgi:O-antigen/teichoic acid export membrane protein
MLGKGARFMIVAQLATFVILAVFTKVGASSLRPAEFGRFAVVLAIAGAMSVFVFGPLAGWASRHYQQAREEHHLRGYYSSLLAGCAAGTIVVLVPVLTLHTIAPGWFADLAIDDTLLALAGWLGIAVGASDVAIAVSNAALRYALAGAFLLLSAALRLGAAIAVAITVPSAERLALWTGLGLAALGLSHALLIWWIDRSAMTPAPGDARRYLRQLATYTSPFLIWALPSYVLTFADRLTLAQTWDPHVVGTYAAMTAATLGLANVVTTTIGRAVNPVMFAMAGGASDQVRIDRAHRLNGRIVAALAILTVPIVAVYGLASGPLISLFSSPEYASQAQLLAPLMLSAMLFAVSQQLINFGLVLKTPWAYMPSKFIHACVVLVLLVTLVPPYGIAGVVVSLLAGNTLQVGIVLITNTLLGRRSREAAELPRAVA